MNSSRPERRHLVIYAKAPRLGRVKSRLARDIGVVPAWQFYRQNLHRLVRRMSQDTRWKLWVAVTPDKTPTPFSHYKTMSRIDQGTGDLGDRMARTMSTLPPGPVVIIGTDIPEIQRSDIWQAFRNLGHHDAVIGPATDGGYWMIGLKRKPHIPDLFSRVRWSTAHAMSDTLTNLDGRGRTIHMLRELEDVDDAASYDRWRDKVR